MIGPRCTAVGSYQRLGHRVLRMALIACPNIADIYTQVCLEHMFSPGHGPTAHNNMR